MRKNSRLTSQTGFSIVEVLVAAGIVSLTFYGMVTLFSNYAKLVGNLGEDKAQYLAVANFRESIMAEPAQYQMVANEFEGELKLTPDKLPWFLSKSELVSLATCTASGNCGTYDARLGFVIYPHESRASRNIYTLKIRLYDIKGNFAQDFRYLVSPK